MRFSAALIFSSVLLVSASPVRRQAGQAITSCTQPGVVALTFDDGPSPYLRAVVDSLSAVGGKATFFLNGQNFYNIFDPEPSANLMYAVQNGHQVASHTWSHAHLTSLSRDQIVEELKKVDDAIQQIAGVRPAFMRPPYGEYNELVLDVAREEGQTVVIWDFDSGDSMGASPDQSKAAYDTAAQSFPKSLLALNHDTHETTATVVAPHAIQVLTQAGYKLVTVAECLGLPAYQ